MDLIWKIVLSKNIYDHEIKMASKKNGKLILLNKNFEEIVTVILWTNNFKQMQKGRRIVIIAVMVL